ncbi:MAG: hypothetical protein ACP5N2_01675 [Candidatus Nanoarchaeia archaeon]
MKDLTAMVGAYSTYIPTKQPYKDFFVYEEEKGIFILEEGQSINSAVRFPVSVKKYCEFWSNIPKNFLGSLKNYATAKSYLINEKHNHPEKITESNGNITRFTPIDPLYVNELHRR